MITYIALIQRQFIDVYGFKENPEKPGLPIHVPDGVYPMTINGRVDHVKIEDGFINCGNFGPIGEPPAAPSAPPHPTMPPAQRIEEIKEVRPSIARGIVGW